MRRLPCSPSLEISLMRSEITVISCMMIVALMYGFMPIATMLKRDRPPPEKRSSSPSSACELNSWARAAWLAPVHRLAFLGLSALFRFWLLVSPHPRLRRFLPTALGGVFLFDCALRGLGGQPPGPDLPRLADDRDRAAARLDRLARARAERMGNHGELAVERARTEDLDVHAGADQASLRQ